MKFVNQFRAFFKIALVGVDRYWLNADVIYEQNNRDQITCFQPISDVRVGNVTNYADHVERRMFDRQSNVDLKSETSIVVDAGKV